MKTLYSPDTAAAWTDGLRDMALANPVMAFAAMVIACGLFATWAAR